MGGYEFMIKKCILLQILRFPMDNIYVKSLLDLLHLGATITWVGTLFVNFAFLGLLVLFNFDLFATYFA